MIKKVNPFIFSKIEIIKDIDNSIESEDLLTDCFMYFYSREFLDVGIKEIKNYLSNYKTNVCRIKRKCNKQTGLILDDFSSCESIGDLDTLLFVKEILTSLNQEDKEYINLYFYQGYTYEQIAEVMPLKSKNGVKYKIDTIIKKLRDSL